MIEAHIDTILYVTGAATASMLLQFIMPRRLLSIFNQIELGDPAAVFFARSAGLAIGLMGVLIVWAG